MKFSVVGSPEPYLKPLGLSRDFEKQLKLASELGYDGIELMVARSHKVDVEFIMQLLNIRGIVASAIDTGPTYTLFGLSLASPDPNKRKKALKRLEGYLELTTTSEHQ